MSRTTPSLPQSGRETCRRHGRFQCRAEPTAARRLRRAGEVLVGNQIFLAAATVAELRYGALVAGWGDARGSRLEQAIEATTVVPVSDALLTTVAEVRFESRAIGHPLADRVHGNDLWIAASAIHLGISLLTADRIFDGAPRLTVVG